MKTVVLAVTHLLCIKMKKRCMFGSSNITTTTRSTGLCSLRAFASETAMKQERSASLIERSSAAQLQSLLAECLYLKGLPEESSHLAQ